MLARVRIVGEVSFGYYFFEIVGKTIVSKDIEIF